MIAWMLEEVVKASIAFVARFLLKRVGVMNEETGTKCMIKNCSRHASAFRGLCLVCYGKAKKKVESGDTTWEKLEAMGLCKSNKDPFDDAYSKAMEEHLPPF